jgi:Endosomal/lysosomal potassium channel TMEM175
MPKSRLESFSDCVIAFAITLLVLDIHVQTIAEDINNPMMLQTLLGLVPQFSVYVIKLPDLYGLVDLPSCIDLRTRPCGPTPPLA